MALVIARVAWQGNLIDDGLFGQLVLVGVLTTAMTPILFENVQRRYGLD